MPHRPSKRKARGYDVLVWIDQDGDIVTSAYTLRGEQGLKKMEKTYSLGDIMEIFIYPDEFGKMMKDYRVGFVEFPSKKVRPMQQGRLH